jgi:hypothetical protein
MRFTHVDIWFCYFGFNVVAQISLMVVSRVRKLIFAKQNVEQINIQYMYIGGKKIDLFVQIGFTTAYVISAYHQ